MSKFLRLVRGHLAGLASGKALLQFFLAALASGLVLRLNFVQRVDARAIWQSALCGSDSALDMAVVIAGLLPLIVFVSQLGGYLALEFEHRSAFTLIRVRSAPLWGLGFLAGILSKGILCALSEGIALALVCGPDGFRWNAVCAYAARLLELALIHVLLFVYAGKKAALLVPILLGTLCLGIPAACAYLPTGMTYLTIQMASGTSPARMLIQETCFLCAQLAGFFVLLIRVDWMTGKSLKS